MTAATSRSLSRRARLFAILAIALLAVGCSAPAGSAPAPASGAAAAADPALAELRVDYATYSPPSLVLKKQGWVEEAFKGTVVKWVYSAGSSNALNFLQGNAVDFGSTAGSAALLSRANGNPIKAVYIYEQPEWTALVVAKDSTAKSITDLKGKKIAAQKGTDPYFFLLRTLNQAGLSQADIQFVNLPHADGRTALERGQVDAWSGLDPHMAASELQAGAKLIYRNKDFNTYGFLNGREAFVTQYPATTRTLIGLYERAKQWITDHPDDAAAILAEAAQLDISVAKRELNERMNFKTSGIPGDAHIAVLKAVVPIINAEQLANAGTNVDKAVTDLIDGSYAKAVIK
ncbi:MAG: sulfonate transport system substrate-binding protein [Chloroflexota bacterium]|jgi:sulfonate transport system substrate-binding protein|nr:sulfonate transport system substrate-binding protein [Chloroflexota bacterium]